MFAAMGLFIAFLIWELIFMMLGVTIHFILQNLIQIILHVTSIIYTAWSIFSEWSVPYYWAVVWILGFTPWFIDLTLFYWGVFRFRPRGLKKLRAIS